MKNLLIKIKNLLTKERIIFIRVFFMLSCITVIFFVFTIYAMYIVI